MNETKQNKQTVNFFFCVLYDSFYSIVKGHPALSQTATLEREDKYTQVKTEVKGAS